MTDTNRGAFAGVFDRWKRVKNTAGALLAPYGTVRFMAGLDAVEDAASEEIRVTLDGSLGFAMASRIIYATDGISIDNGGFADLSADRTLRAVPDPLSLRILTGTIATLYPLSETPDPGTIGVRTLSPGAGVAATHGQGALLAARLVGGGSDDSSATEGIFAAPKVSVGLAFRNDDDDKNIRAVETRADNKLFFGHAGGGDWQAAPTFIGGGPRVEFDLANDGAETTHSYLAFGGAGMPAGPKVFYDGTVGTGVIHAFPEGGSFEVWEQGDTPVLRFRVAQAGLSDMIVASHTIGTSDATPALLLHYTLDVAGYSYTLIASVQIRSSTGEISHIESAATFLADSEADFSASGQTGAIHAAHAGVVLAWSGLGGSGEDALLTFTGLIATDLAVIADLRIRMKTAL